MNINKDKPIVGCPFAAPLSGKDTVEKGLTQTHTHIAIIHMSTLLQVIIHQNENYKKIVEEGGLLPPQEAVKAFRRGFLSIMKDTPNTSGLPHVFANGACREEYETKANIAMIRRVKKDAYQMVGFRFLLDKEHILSRAAERVKQTLEKGQKPRLDDMGDTPVNRYSTFHKNLGPVLRVFEQQGGVVVDIDANKAPEQVLAQVAKVYDYVTLSQAVA